MQKNPIAVINDFSGGQDTKTPIISMGLNKSPNMRNFHCAGVKERIVKRGGRVKVNSIVIDTDNLDTHYPPGYQTYNYPLRTTIGYTKISQGFKPKTSSTVTKINLWLKKTGTPAGTDTITLEIMTDSDGIPSGTVVTDGTSIAVDCSDTLTTSYAWVTFTFSTPPTLSAGTQYHLVLSGAYTISGANYVSWGVDNYDIIFVDGSMGKYDSYVWEPDINYNACFEVFITGGLIGNDGVALYDFASKNMLIGLWGTSLYKMDKNSFGTPDGIWDSLMIGSASNGTLDFFEYSSDVNAQTAYVTNATETVDQTEGTSDISQTLGNVAGINYQPAQSFKLSAALQVTAISLYTGTKTGSPAGNWTLRIETDNAGAPSGILANANATITDISPVANNTIFKMTFATPFQLTGATTYWILLQCDNQTTNVRWLIQALETGNYANGHNSYTTNGGASWTDNSPIDLFFRVHVQALQSYSESANKSQGSYSLKAVAAITTSLNKTLTRTIGVPINLTGKTAIYFDIYSSRTGANIKIGIHDSGGTTSEKTHTVVAANTWETVIWDISAVSNANKDAIDSIVITILNADDNNTFYIDNMYAIITGSEYFFTSSRYITFADWQSGLALINTDIGLYSYAGTGNAAVVSAAPIGKFIVIFRNYVFMAGIRGLPNSIRYSDLSDYTTWTASQILNVITNDGDVITGMRMLKGKLYIFKRYSIHRISYLGSNPTFQVDQILGVGCPAHYTIKEVELGGDVGTVLIFLTTDKKLAVFDGYNIQIINDSLVEESNDLFGSTDDQPLSFADMNLVYSDLFHAVVKNDTSEYILYCVLGTDTAVNYAFVFDYKTGGVQPYDAQPFASSCFAISTNKSKLLYCAGYSGYMWQMESGTSDDGSAINGYWVSPKIKPSIVSMLTKALQLGINLKEAYSVSTLNAYFQLRIDWNVSWTTAEAFTYNRADVLTFGKTVLFDVGTVENMLQIKISDNSTNLPITLYGVDLYGEVLGRETGERAVA